MLRKKKEKKKKKKNGKIEEKKHTWCGRYKFFLVEALPNRFFFLKIAGISKFSGFHFFPEVLRFFFETEISKLINILRFSQNKHRTITVSRKTFLHTSKGERIGGVSKL